LAAPLPDGTSAVEVAEFTPVDCCAQTATLVQDIAVLQRSLSQVAEALDASEARADALAGKLLKSERTVRGLQRENAALHSPLEAPPCLEEIPETIAALSQTRGSSSNTPQISPDAGDIRYPATLPVSGAQLAGDWHGFFQMILHRYSMLNVACFTLLLHALCCVVRSACRMLQVAG
jgi:hypothetical protein